MAAPPPRRALAASLLGLALALALAACRGAAPELPVDGHRELCCKAADPDNMSFIGCRATGYCRATESVWLRGPVRCTPAGEQGCAGERCCELAVEPLSAPEPEPEPEPEEAAPSEKRPSAPAPAPIEIVPLDWTPATSEQPEDSD